MPNAYKPLAPELIDEGRFPGQVRQSLAEVQAALLKHYETYGDRTNSGKAKLKIEIALVWERKKDMEVPLHSIKVEFKKDLPQPPASVGLALASEDHEGRPCLMVQASGSRSEDPRQGRLCTDDGRTIDQETGEVVEALEVQS